MANYVLSLSGSPHDSVRASQGKVKFAACAACHGQDGKGMQAIGAPNLTDGVWLHGWGEDAIIKAVKQRLQQHHACAALSTKGKSTCWHPMCGVSRVINLPLPTDCV
ncbi:MAG: hypothetical protein R3E56_09460 [Burkholderiaceae bacterium]